MLSHIHFFSTLRDLHTLDFVYSRTAILGYENDGDIIGRWLTHPNLHRLAELG